MTFIASLKVKNGLMQISDSLELQTGAISRYDDFIKLISQKQINEENNEPKLTAKEVFSTYKPERIKNIDSAKKTYKVSNYASIQISGNVEIHGKKVKQIINDFVNDISKNQPLNHQQVADYLMDILKPNFPDRGIEEFENPSINDSIPNTEFIYSHYDHVKNEKHIHLMKYMPNRFTQRYTYSDLFESRKDFPFISSGMIGLAHSFDTLQGYIFNDINFNYGYRILTLALDLAILTEKINFEIPGVGGTIIYSIINKDGFRFISDINDLPDD